MCTNEKQIWLFSEFKNHEAQTRNNSLMEQKTPVLMPLSISREHWSTDFSRLIFSDADFWASILYRRACTGHLYFYSWVFRGNIDISRTRLTFSEADIWASIICFSRAWTGHLYFYSEYFDGTLTFPEVQTYLLRSRHLGLDSLLF